MLTADRLRELLDYDPLTGRFTWRTSTRNGTRIGDVAGSRDEKGYVRIVLDRATYTAARLAFLYMQGEWPEHEIDHRNLNKADNCWLNLRPATRSENRTNSAGWSWSGFKNLHHRSHLPSCWRVQVKGAPRKSFACLGQALKYRNDMLRKHHGFYANFDNAPANKRIKWTIRP